MSTSFATPPPGHEEGEADSGALLSSGRETEADDLSGAPLRLVISVQEQAPELNEKDQRKKDKMLEHSIVYVQPGQARITLLYEGRKLPTSRSASLSSAPFRL